MLLFSIMEAQSDSSAFSLGTKWKLGCLVEVCVYSASAKTPTVRKFDQLEMQWIEWAEGGLTCSQKEHCSWSGFPENKDSVFFFAGSPILTQLPTKSLQDQQTMRRAPMSEPSRLNKNSVTRFGDKLQSGKTYPEKLSRVISAFIPPQLLCPITTIRSTWKPWMWSQP